MVLTSSSLLTDLHVRARLYISQASAASLVSILPNAAFLTQSYTQGSHVVSKAYQVFKPFGIVTLLPLNSNLAIMEKPIRTDSTGLARNSLLTLQRQV